MNVTLPNKTKNNKLLIIYIVIFLLCVVGIIVAIYQIKSDDNAGLLLGAKEPEMSDEEELKAGFEKIFTNDLIVQQDNINADKIDQNQKVVYTNYQKKEEVTNSYDVDVNIPCININNDQVKEYNQELEKTFATKAESILKTENKNEIFNVNYIAYVKDNILSLAIYSNLKEGNNVQRVLVQTYNYDLQNNKKLTLEDLIKLKNIPQDELQAKIKTEIQNAQTQSEQLGQLGYNIYSRDASNKMYQIENTTEFFEFDNHLYLVYPYGNNNATSEMDIVIY